MPTIGWFSTAGESGMRSIRWVWSQRATHQNNDLDNADNIEEDSSNTAVSAN